MAERNQRMITLSDRALEEYEMVAEWLGMPPNTLLRQILEDHHQSPEFGDLVRRAKLEANEPKNLSS